MYYWTASQLCDSTQGIDWWLLGCNATMHGFCAVSRGDLLPVLVLGHSETACTDRLLVYLWPESLWGNTAKIGNINHACRLRF